MGEQAHSFATGHLWSIMRSSRGKLFIYFSVLGLMVVVVFLLSSTHSNLKLLESSHEKCQQQRDSLSAQLQVLYEHKNRLEKSLQQEKTDHKNTKEEHEKNTQKQDFKLRQAKDKQQSLESQITQIKASYSELESDKKHAEEVLNERMTSLQSQKDDEIKKLQAQISDLLAEKDKLEQTNSALTYKIEQHSDDANLCRARYSQLEIKMTDCNSMLLKKSKEAAEKSPKPTLSSNTNNNLATKESAIPSPGPMPEASKDKPKALERPHVQGADDNKEADKEDTKDQHLNNFADNLQDLNMGNTSKLETQPVQLPKIDESLANPKEVMDKEQRDVNDIEPHDHANGNLNIPQVQPPESIHQGAEKGEYGNGMPLAQLDQPEYRENDIQLNASKKKIPNQSVNDGAHEDEQIRNMLLKSPDGGNDGLKNNAPNIPPPHDLPEFGNKLNREPNNLRHDIPGGLDDKNYAEEDDDDQDGENDDDMGAGNGHPLRGKAFNEEADFHDHEGNVNNGKDEEGVMVAPR